MSRPSPPRSQDLPGALAALALAAVVLGVLALHAQTRADSGRGPAERTMGHGGRQRTYLVHDFGRGTAPAPVVIVLHGGGGNAENAVRMTGFDRIAARDGIIAVYPDGTSRLPRMRHADVERRALLRLGDGGQRRRRRVHRRDHRRAGVERARRSVPRLRHRDVERRHDGAPPRARALDQARRDRAGGGRRVRRRAAAAGAGARVHHRRRRGRDRAARRRTAAGARPARPQPRPTATSRRRSRRRPTGRATTAAASRRGRRPRPPAGWSGGAAPAARRSSIQSVAGNGHAWPGGEPGREGAAPPTRDFDASDAMWEFFKTQARRH